jgi:hypothetical protein
LSKRFIIVTGANEAYAEFVDDLAASLEPFRTELRFDIGVFDFGLTAATRAAMQHRFAAVIAPPWPFRPDPRFDRQVQARAFATRPFLPDFFTGYDAYCWMDADTFVQDPRGILLLMAASRPGLAGVIPAIDRSYNHTQSNQDLVRERYRTTFGAEVAQRLSNAPYIDSGVVCASATSPLWRLWRERYQTTLENYEGDHLPDQAILNHVVYLESLPHHRLPAVCNWTSHLALPMADIEHGVLVEPSYPHYPIYIVANSFNDKRALRRFARTDGRGVIECALTLGAARAALIAARGPA